MVPELEKPKVTEIKVRMDCNGCVQKVKKALQGVTGIYDFYIDFPQQKITIIGWADPVKIVKAIKKTRKSAVICSHTEHSTQQDQPREEQEPESSLPDGGVPPPESTNLPAEPPQTEAAAPPEDGQTEPPQTTQTDNQPPKVNPPPDSANEMTNQPIQPPISKDLEEIHVIYHCPPEYGYRHAYGHYQQQGTGTQWNANPNGPAIRYEPPQPAEQLHAIHSYNTYTASPYITEYARPQSLPGYSYYNGPEHYNEVYYNGGNNNNSSGHITSIFSEENPNACSIV